MNNAIYSEPDQKQKMDIDLINHNKIMNKTDTYIYKQTTTKQTYITKLKNEDDLEGKV